MLQLDRSLTITKALAEDPNLATRFDHEDRGKLGAWVRGGFNRDLHSRDRWATRMESAMDLALQLQKAKTFPWPDSSNVVFPLVTIAALQFHSQAYPALVPGENLVRYKLKPGTEDPGGVLKAKADRVGNTMSWQMIEEDQCWEEQHDRLLMALPILGCMFIKTLHNAEERHNVSELVMPQNLVLNYYAKSVESCRRKTQIIELHRNDIYERVKGGVFRNVLDDNWYQSLPTETPTIQSNRKDQRTGETPPPPDENTPFKFLEQHTWLDLDQDGYAEPYIMTTELQSNALCRLVARWDREEDVVKHRGEIHHIRATESFTKYTFLPSPDGGIYDLGFGMMLGPLNESVNSLINQLIDAGTMSNSAGGFLGRGSKLRGGIYTFGPFEWHTVDSRGDDIRKNMFPLPVREPSRVLLDLLTLLIDYAQRIPGSVDITTGIMPGQNTPAETSRNSLAEARKIFSAIYKRCWRAMKEEFAKLYQLNAANMTGQERNDFLDDPRRIAPTANPSIISDGQILQQALAVKESAMTTPGYSIPEVEKKYLAALHVDDAEIVYPGPDKVPPLKHPKLQVEEMKLKGLQMKQQEDTMQFILKLREEQRVNTAKIAEMEAQAANLMAGAKGVEVGHQIALLEAAIGAAKVQSDSMSKYIELMMKGVSQIGDTNAGGMGPPAGEPGGGAATPSPELPAGAPEGGLG